MSRAETSPQTAPPVGPGELVRRHRLSTRLWHWVNAVTLAVMLMSGLMIFNAHPRLYWGDHGARPDAAWLEIRAVAGQGEVRGELQVGPYRFDTTGVLGRWTDADGRPRNRAFPYWITLPSGYSLALARGWHLTFAWLLVLSILAYLGRSLFNGHLRHALLPRREELTPRHIGKDITSHLRLRFPQGAAALRYNILQKLAYLSVLLVLIPGMILSGLAMSPAVAAGWPWLLDLFQGHASARSMHFIFAFLLVVFFLVHMVMVLLSGPFNNLRGMITGRIRLPGKGDK